MGLDTKTDWLTLMIVMMMVIMMMMVVVMMVMIIIMCWIYSSEANYRVRANSHTTDAKRKKHTQGQNKTTNLN
jgi:uncharacterized membrane protein